MVRLFLVRPPLGRCPPWGFRHQGTHPAATGGEGGHKIGFARSAITCWPPTATARPLFARVEDCSHRSAKRPPSAAVRDAYKMLWLRLSKRTHDEVCVRPNSTCNLRRRGMAFYAATIFFVAWLAAFYISGLGRTRWWGIGGFAAGSIVGFLAAIAFAAYEIRAGSNIEFVNRLVGSSGLGFFGAGLGTFQGRRRTKSAQLPRSIRETVSFTAKVPSNGTRGIVKAALILGAAIVLAVALYVYFSPYQTCVRAESVSDEPRFRPVLETDVVLPLPASPTGPAPAVVSGPSAEARCAALVTRTQR